MLPSWRSHTLHSMSLSLSLPSRHTRLPHSAALPDCISLPSLSFLVHIAPSSAPRLLRTACSLASLSGQACRQCAGSATALANFCVRPTTGSSAGIDVSVFVCVSFCVCARVLRNSLAFHRCVRVYATYPYVFTYIQTVSQTDPVWPFWVNIVGSVVGIYCLPVSDSLVLTQPF